MKYTVTYLSGPDDGDAPFTTFRGMTFPRGVAVKLAVSTPDGQSMISKLKGNRFFKVEAIGEDIEVVEPNVDAEKPKAKAKPSKSVKKDDDGSADA